MTPAVLALPSALFRLQCHLKSPLLPSSIPIIKAFSSSLALDTEETPAMKTLKDIPSPSASPDPSIFESWSDEYKGVPLPRAVLAQKSIDIEKVASAQSADQRYHESHILERLSRNGNFVEAEQVRQELAEMNVPIRPSGTYYRNAWYVIRQRPWPPNRTERFTNWLSLLPSWTSDAIPPGFGFTMLRSALLFNSNQLDLKTVAQFGIVLSSKGYLRNVGPSVVACLTRYADPDVSARVLDEMIAANDDFSRSKLRTSHDASTGRFKNAIRALWSIAVRSHCTAGRPKVALQIAKRAHELDFRLTQFTYEYLLGKLENDGLDDLAAELRAHPYCGSLDVAKSRLVANISKLTSLPPISREQSMIVNQAIALAILKRSRLGLPASAADLVSYFDIHKTDLRGGEAVYMFRTRAYRISLAAISHVLLAELLHHYRRGQFRHVLWVFEKFFHVVGVSSEDVTRRLWKREHYPPHLHISPPLPPRITKTTFNLPSRLWPTPYHTSLIWSALVQLCESEEELFALYDSLLQHSAQFQKTTVDHHRRYHHHNPSHGSGLPAPVPGPADRFDAAHFNPFLIAFTQLCDAKHGLRVLDDMQDRGIAPSAEILGMTGALQARYGEPALALRTLDIMRGLVRHDGDEKGDVEMDMVAGSEMGGRVKKRQLLLSAYTSVLRGFIDRRDVVHARRIAELLHSHLGYVEGEGGSSSGNARPDATQPALRYLRRLEAEGPNAIPEFLPDADYFYPFLKRRDPEVRPPNLFIIFSNRSPVRSSHPRAPLLSPWGKPFCYCVFFLSC
jgi:pentatricopeptide repeat protein